MKKIIAITIFVILFLSGLGAVSGQYESNENIIKEKILFSEPILKDTTDYVTIDLAEKTSYLLDPGKPRLPVVTKIFTFPIGTKISSVDVTLTFDSTKDISKKIMPNAERTPLSKSPSSKFIKIDNSVYDSAAYYPSIDYDYTMGAGLDGEDHVLYLAVHCYPIKYSPKQDTVTFASAADISIKYEKQAHPINAHEDYDLVIITSSEFTEALQPLVDHKNSKGIVTMIKTVEDIYAECQGRDEQEQIKYFIYDALENMSISYVMLVGSIDIVPIRYTDIEVFETNGVPTDLYYADIYDEYWDFCSWDSNGNDRFGEFNWEHGPIDDVDLYADVGIGRLACSSLEEVSLVVDKIITYETETYGSSWFDDIIVMGGDTFPGWSVVEGEVVTQEVIDIMTDFTPTQLWASLNTFRPFKINSEITRGAGFVSYSGHGYAQGFGTSKPDVEERIQYYSYRLPFMRNKEKLPIVFFDACSTTQLDFTWEGFEEFYPFVVGLIKILNMGSYDPLALYPCFAWMLIKKANGGAIATVGSTRVAYTNVDEFGIHGGASYLNVKFFEGYEPGISVSDMLTSAQNDYLNYVGLDCFTLEEFNLLGDPSLKVGGYV